MPPKVEFEEEDEREKDKNTYARGFSTNPDAKTISLR
jgi:hypothetical protein